MNNWHIGSLTVGSSILIGLAAVWSLLGLAAFIYSLVCVGKTPSLVRGIAGIVISAIFGPFYWLYWAFDKNYCRNVFGSLPTQVL